VNAIWIARLFEIDDICIYVAVIVEILQILPETVPDPVDKRLQLSIRKAAIE